MAKRLFGDQTAPSSIWFAIAPPVRQYWPGALDRTAPSESRISKLSTPASGASASGRPGMRHANARRLEGDIVPSTTRAAPGPSPQVRPPSRSDTHGPISALADKAAATVRKGTSESKPRMVSTALSPRRSATDTDSFRLEVHRYAVDAVAQMRRRRPVLEHVTEMAAATAAVHLRAHHAIG